MHELDLRRSIISEHLHYPVSSPRKGGGGGGGHASIHMSMHSLDYLDVLACFRLHVVMIVELALYSDN